MTIETEEYPLPRAFIGRRLHSLTGIWLVLFIIQHLFTNSQAALWIGDDGASFIKSVNDIHDLPFLPLIEIAVLAFPILIHMIWGIEYLRRAKYNSFGYTGHTPYLPDYPRNRAYTWQRVTAWLLIVGIIAHVVHMRFIDYPEKSHLVEKGYMVRITDDEGLAGLAERLNVKLYNADELRRQPNFSKRPLKPGEVFAVADNFGTAELLVVRDTFKVPYMLVLYTLFVLIASFHAFNGFWTFLITWGVTLTQRSQRLLQKVSVALMIIFGCLGLSAVWLTYWVNLKG